MSSLMAPPPVPGGPAYGARPRTGSVSVPSHALGLAPAGGHTTSDELLGGAVPLDQRITAVHPVVPWVRRLLPAPARTRVKSDRRDRARGGRLLPRPVRGHVRRPAVVGHDDDPLARLLPSGRDRPGRHQDGPGQPPCGWCPRSPARGRG